MAVTAEVGSGEKRTAERYPASRMPSIHGVRLSPGDIRCTLINISTTGVLVECDSRPRPGAAMTVQFEGSFSPSSIRGRVARTIVASFAKDGLLRYMVGIAFDTAIDVPAPAPPPAPSPEFVPRIVRSRPAAENRW